MSKRADQEMQNAFCRSDINSLFALTPQQITIPSSPHKKHQFPGFQRFLIQTFTKNFTFFLSNRGG